MKHLWLIAALTVSGAQAQTTWIPVSPAKNNNTTARPGASESYFEAIIRTAAMVESPEVNRLAANLGLNVLNLTWEDTGRYKNSAVGPNISDMTIQVANGPDVTCMPVIRYPNFSDKTGDLNPDQFTLMVGNQNGSRLQRVSLTEFLKDPTRFMSRPDSWRSPNKSLWSERDTHVLTSAQACFLPVPKQGKATFNPVLFNYQSRSGDPAVLTILATREGTSMTVIDNKRDAFKNGNQWGQRLFFNQNGQRASLTGERMSDFSARPGNGGAASQPGMNMALLIQVPLRQRENERVKVLTAAPGVVNMAAKEATENAVIGHGAVEGPFTEIDNLVIQRDERFPIRVTVQFYKATSTGDVSAKEMADIQKSINSIYAQASSVGSLVTAGETGRPTEYWGAKVQPADWWQRFWERHQQNTGDTPSIARAKLARLLGPNYMKCAVNDLYLSDLLRK